MLQVREVVKPAIPFAIQSAASLSAFTLGLALTQARCRCASLFSCTGRISYQRSQALLLLARHFAASLSARTLGLALDGGARAPVMCPPPLASLHGGRRCQPRSGCAGGGPGVPGIVRNAGAGVGGGRGRHRRGVRAGRPGSHLLPARARARARRRPRRAVGAAAAAAAAAGPGAGRAAGRGAVQGVPWPC